MRNLILRLRAGCIRPTAFHALLKDIYRRITLDQPVTEWEDNFVTRWDVQMYWRDVMQHTWIAHCTHGGVLDIGIHNRREAIEMFGRIEKRGTIIKIDDAHHFIFFKIDG